MISFYAALGVLLVFVARGLLRMRSWARRATMLYAALYPVFILVHFLTVWFFGDCLFNINLFSLLYRFIAFDYPLRSTYGDAVILMLTASASLVVVPIYLSSGVKHEFR